MEEKEPDLRFTNHGSIVLLSYGTKAGKQWIEQHIDLETSMSWCGDIVVEPHHAVDIVFGATKDGLTID